MNHNIIQLVTTSVLNLLKEDFKRNNIKGVECLNWQPSAQKLANEMPCCTFYLHSVAENHELKERETYQVKDRDRDGNIYEFLREPPIKLDLGYLLCSFAKDPDLEQQILGRAILVLYDNSELSRLPEFKEIIKHPADKIGLRMMPTGPDERLQFWRAMREPIRPAAFYQVTVRIESERQKRFRRVEERILDIHQKGQKEL